MLAIAPLARVPEGVGRRIAHANRCGREPTRLEIRGIHGGFRDSARFFRRMPSHPNDRVPREQAAGLLSRGKESRSTPLARALESVRRRIVRANRSGLNEQNTKATLIEPVLRALGREVDDVEEEVREHRVKARDKPVDYGLLVLRDAHMRSTAADNLARAGTRPRMLSALISLCVGLALIGCSSPGWKAPPKRQALQAQLQAIGRSKALDMQKVMAHVKSALDTKGPVDLAAVAQALKAALPQDISLGFDQIWCGIMSRVGTVGDRPDDDRQRLRSAIIEQLSSADEDNRLYWLAKGLEPRDKAGNGSDKLDPKDYRDALISKYIVRIQDYHEANYEDVFKSAAEIGFQLDAGTTIAASLATAFTPLSTKTGLAALATILAGTRLAASKNVLNEKTSAAVLNAMITQRTEGLTLLTNGMKQPISGDNGYSVDTAVIQLSSYFNAGGLDKAIAQMEQDTSRAKSKAEDALKDAQKTELKGLFIVSGSAPGKKLVARLHFDDKDLPGAVSVSTITVDGVALASADFKTSDLDDDAKTPQVTFEAGHAPNKDAIVIIGGRASKAGSHVGRIEWQ